jgi:hypothetical protein
MNKSILTTILVITISVLKAQLQTPISLVSTAGDLGQATINGSTSSVEWTIGEVFIGGGAAGNYNITNGQQQGFPDTLTLSIAKTPLGNFLVYPNPASEAVHIDNLPQGSKTILIYDINGREISAFNTAAEKYAINTSQFSSGVYLIRIETDMREQASIKILITNH